MAKRRKPRGLDETEHKLWQKVTAAITPITSRPLGTLPDPRTDAPEAGPARKPAKPKKSAAAVQPVPARPALPARPAATRKPPAPHDAGTIDGGLQRKLRRGRIDPDAKIDLHGLNQAQAHQRLRTDLPRLRVNGARCLLVVTGKGSATTLARHTLHGSEISQTPERRGVLRDSLPGWLAEAEFRPHVAAVRPAHPRHGGGGAFYVWLRRQR